MLIDLRKVAVTALLAMSASLLACSAALAEGPEIIRVGDSVSKVTTAHLVGRIAGLQVLNWDDADQTTSQSVVDLRHAFTPATSVVVFDTGTNLDPREPQLLTRSLHQVARIVGDACLVVPTLEPPVSPHLSSNAKNRALFEFAASRSRTLVPEWSGAVEMEPGLRIRSHGLYTHPNAATFRANMIARAIRRCLAIAKGRREPRPKPTWLTPVHRIRQAVAGEAGAPAAEGSGPPARSAQVSIGVPRSLGQILVNGLGESLYTFSADKKGSNRSACYGQCAKVWPPFVTEGPPEVYKEGVGVSLLGTIERRGGIKQVTYAGYPLYLYSRDRSGGLAGIGLSAFGGRWYPLHPDGTKEKG